jgi:serine/threonine protein kinase
VTDWETRVCHHISSKWSRYQRGKKIGSGGYSRVFECVDKETGVKRVCKVMSEENEYNFHKELKILSMLQVLLLQLSLCSMPLLLLVHSQFTTSARI